MMPHPFALATSLSLLVATIAASGAPARVTFSAIATPVAVDAVFEVMVAVEAPTAADCVTDVRVTGEFRHEADREAVRVEGSCDSEDGSLFRVRFTPRRPGEYDWRVTYRQGEFERVGAGSLTAIRREARHGE